MSRAPKHPRRPRHLPGFRRASQVLRLLGRAAPVPDAPPSTSFAALDAPVRVAFDPRGVPRVEAQSARDALFAQGFLHARERAFQMDMARRWTAGRLAELLGPAGLPFDRFTRQLGLGASANEAPDTWPEAVRREADAYVAGVNAAFATLPVPSEHRLLKVTLEPWTIRDTAADAGQLAWLLNDVWQVRWAESRLAQRPEVWAWLHPPGWPPVPTVIVPGTGSAAMVAGAGGVGSNNWVVSGAHTASGRPLLANDPHLPILFPSTWYAVHLDAPDLGVFGVSIPGLPGVIIGQNRDLAWGVTNVNPDVQDLYRVVLEEDGRHYQVDGQPYELDTRVEAVAVRGGQTVPVTCRRTLWGPVMAEDDAGAVVSLAWTGLSPSPVVPAVLDLNRAHDWDTFKAALAQWTVPAQNFVYADRQGHIGYVMAGELPRRPERSPTPLVDGNTRRFAWDGFWPPARHPCMFDPPTGLIVTANNPVVGDEAAVPVPGRFTLGDRARRIHERLAETDAHTLDTFRAIQQDVHAERLMALSRRLAQHPALPPRLAPLLAQWDGRLTPDAAAPTLLHLFCWSAVPPRVQEALNQPFFPGETPGAPGSHPYPERLWELVGDRLVALVLFHWDTLDIAAGLSAAVATATRALGPDPAAWAWGDARVIRAFHPLASAARLAPVFARPRMRLGGDALTVLQTPEIPDAVSWPRPVRITPSWRVVLDPGDSSAAWSVLATGQSGHPLSPHYDDQMDAFAGGALFPLGPGMVVAGGFTLAPSDET